jgi:uncharacterized membrane protein
MANNGTVGKWSPEQLAQCLGWFSIGLGLAEVLAPKRMSRLIGARQEHSFLLRLLGVREIASGVGILSRRRPAGWVWSRVGGDAMDLAFLSSALSPENPQRNRAAAATAAVVGVTALDFLCGQELSRSTTKPAGDGATHVETSVTINRTPEELYRFWRDFQNLPRFMNHLVSVQVSGPTRSHWVAKGPAGTDVEWDAEIVTDTPNQVISWRSLEGADVANAGSVRFERAPGGRGTIVRVKMQYRPMGGSVGSAVAKMLGKAPEKQVKVDLYRLKQILETGEAARTEGQPAGRARSTSRKYDDLVRS